MSSRSNMTKQATKQKLLVADATKAIEHKIEVALSAVSSLQMGQAQLQHMYLVLDEALSIVAEELKMDQAELAKKAAERAKVAISAQLASQVAARTQRQQAAMAAEQPASEQAAQPVSEQAAQPASEQVEATVGRDASM